MFPAKNASVDLLEARFPPMSLAGFCRFRMYVSASDTSFPNTNPSFTSELHRALIHLAIFCLVSLKAYPVMASHKKMIRSSGSVPERMFGGNHVNIIIQILPQFVKNETGVAPLYYMEMEIEKGRKYLWCVEGSESYMGA
ncbi:hypothetical protein G2W53_031095 [Senna tora]|uniref:Uncharacterized protein n=1 Tax=Senna tora TaxID=362788 RepID=A0A834TA21_9FABA|nr:hypothetical protein G2W53_031095 [Senna tora]